MELRKDGGVKASDGCTWLSCTLEKQLQKQFDEAEKQLRMCRWVYVATVHIKQTSIVRVQMQSIT